MRTLFLFVCLACFFMTGCYPVRTDDASKHLKNYVASINQNNQKENKDISKFESIKSPARIGIARIDNGVLSPIPSEEVEAWEKLKNELGNEIGEFIPVSRLISAMLIKPSEISANSYTNQNITLHDILRSVRLSAARQHLDAVLIYEVYGTGSSKPTIAYIMNFTIIGAFLFPGRRVETSCYGSAVLLDVRSGHPFGTASSIVTKTAFMTSPNSYQKQLDLIEKTKTKAGVKLVPEVKKMVLQLKSDLKNFETPKK